MEIIDNSPFHRDPNSDMPAVYDTIIIDTPASSMTEATDKNNHTQHKGDIRSRLIEAYETVKRKVIESVGSRSSQLHPKEQQAFHQYTRNLDTMILPMVDAIRQETGTEGTDDIYNLLWERAEMNTHMQFIENELYVIYAL